MPSPKRQIPSHKFVAYELFLLRVNIAPTAAKSVDGLQANSEKRIQK